EFAPLLLLSPAGSVWNEERQQVALRPWAFIYQPGVLFGCSYHNLSPEDRAGVRLSDRACRRDLPHARNQTRLNGAEVSLIDNKTVSGSSEKSGHKNRKERIMDILLGFDLAIEFDRLTLFNLVRSHPLLAPFRTP